MEIARLTAQLAATEDSSRIGALIAGAAVGSTGATGATVYLLNRAEGFLVSLTDEGNAAQHRLPLHMGGTSLPLLALANHRSVRAGRDLAVPLSFADREVGVVVTEGVIDPEAAEQAMDRLKSVAALALAQLATRQEMFYQWRFLEVITTLNWLITSDLESLEFYDALHQLIKGLIDYDWMKILVTERNNIEVLAFFRDGEAVRPDDALQPSDRTLTSRFATGQPDIVEDLRSVPEFAGDALLRQAGLRSVLLVPLAAKSGVIGGICFYSREKGKYTEKDSPLAQQLAGQLATAIENTLLIKEMARKNSEIEESHRRLATLNATAETLTRSLDLELVLGEVVGKIIEVADWDAGAIFLPQDNGYSLTVFKGLSDEHAQRLTDEQNGADGIEDLVQDEPVTITAENAPPFLKAFFVPRGFSFGIGVPVKYKQEARGILILFDREKQGLSRQESEVLEAVGNQIGVAVENARLYHKVKVMAEHDALTGLFNRHKFFGLLEQELQRCQRYKSKCGILLLDIDHFKDYNDTFGHPAGDECLKRAARIFKESVRSTDVTARYGGEEFVVLVVETSAQGTLSVAERLRRKIETEGGKEPFPTVSIGVAIYPDDAASVQNLLLIADNALYTAKRLGRNRTVWRDAVHNLAPAPENTGGRPPAERRSRT
jgi:diguanylate cyclase (GGDEF)-like protein